MILLMGHMINVSHDLRGYYPVGMQPVLYSKSKQTWQRVGSNISYFRNNVTFKKYSSSSCSSGSEGRGRRKGKMEMVTKRFFTLTFSVVFPVDGDTCFLAYHYPYTYSMLQVGVYMYLCVYLCMCMCVCNYVHVCLCICMFWLYSSCFLGNV